MDCFAVAQSTFLEMLPVSPDLCKDLKLDREIFLFFRLSAAPRRAAASPREIKTLCYWCTMARAAQLNCS